MDLKKSFWVETYQRNIKKMIGLCYRYVSDRQTAEDLAHDSFMSAMKKSDTFKGTGHFDAWLRKITLNTTLLYLRNTQVKYETWQESESHDLIQNDEEMDIHYDYTTDELLDAINQLPEHHRLVFNMYAIDNQSHKQIAEKLNISEGTSKSHLSRARSKLQVILNAKSKEKRKKRAIILFLPQSTDKVDKLYKSSFANYEIDPQNTLFLEKLNWKEINQPTFANLPHYVIPAVVTGIIVSVIAAFILNSTNNTQAPVNIEIPTKVIEKAGVKNTPIDSFNTATPTQIPDSTTKRNDSISENKTPVTVNVNRRESSENRLINSAKATTQIKTPGNRTISGDSISEAKTPVTINSNKREGHNNRPINSVNATSSKKIPATTVKPSDQISESKAEKKQVVVIVKKKRIIQKTIIVQDTLKRAGSNAE